MSLTLSSVSNFDLPLFGDHGDTQGGKKKSCPIRNISHEKLEVKNLIQHLDQVTADGFVFSRRHAFTAFSVNLVALVLNPMIHSKITIRSSRDWERYAMIKARVMSVMRWIFVNLKLAQKPLSYRKSWTFGSDARYVT